MPFMELLKKQFTGTKLLFHFLFWTFHWGIFAYGWYVSGSLRAFLGSSQMLTASLLGISRRPIHAWQA